MARDNNKVKLNPNRSKQVGVVGNDNKQVITIPNPNTMPDPQQAVGIATPDSVRLGDALG